jgi:hypothetical protein
MHTNFGRKPEEKRRRGMYLRKIQWKGVHWIHLAQDRDQWRDLVNMVINLRVP